VNLRARKVEIGVRAGFPRRRRRLASHRDVVAVQNDLGFSGGVNLPARKAETIENLSQAPTRSRRLAPKILF
jgi:hypothetical protein